MFFIIVKVIVSPCTIRHEQLQVIAGVEGGAVQKNQYLNNLAKSSLLIWSYVLKN